MSRLQEQYKSEILKNLYSKLNCKNIHEVPKITKIVLNIGLGEAKDDTKIINTNIDNLLRTKAEAEAENNLELTSIIKDMFRIGLNI